MVLIPHPGDGDLALGVVGDVEGLLEGATEVLHVPKVNVGGIDGHMYRLLERDVKRVWC